MITANGVMVIAGMAVATYLTRVLGFLLLRNRKLSANTKSVLEVAPGCVIVSVIAPYFVSSEPQIWIALAVTIAAATRFSMLITAAIGVATLGMLNQLL
ncbi:putative membrane protein [Pseudomonas sp. GM84]|uniref:AzlD family protein n=1 Tax=Pseudomonas sp. GM84 TaxID=1144340 RepID=UPI00026F4CBE|nr:AzlD family protein [Pseudomonas sp. GM84]EJN39636.1 putative membrane protein [Pseudomonas sp. GM84]